MLKSEDGSEVTQQDLKANILWNSFRNRLGKTDNVQMMFDLDHLIIPQDLSELESPFTTEEIDNVIKHMPNDKSPGPDSFNGLFIKKFWHLIKQQFYDLCNSFYHGNLTLDSINTAYITLIPKINCPQSASDFRPISLVSMALKIITELMSNRLQGRIIPLVSKNQYGFIKTKTIQDCLSWAFEYLHICHKSKKRNYNCQIRF
jgi:hypothetical protein